MDNNPIYQQTAAMIDAEFEKWAATGVVKDKGYIFNIKCKY